MKRLIAALLAVMLFGLYAGFAKENEGELLLGYDSFSGILLPNSVLAVGQRYDFPVFVAANQKVMPLSDELMQKYSFKTAKLSGEKSVKDFGFTKKNGYYYITVLAREEAKHRYSLTLVERSSGLDTLSLTVGFSASEQEKPHSVKNPPTGKAVKIGGSKLLSPIFLKKFQKAIAF